MRSLNTLFLMVLAASMAWADTVWSENFNNDEGVGAVGPTPTITSPSSGKWSVDISGANLTATSDWFRVQNGVFEARDLDGECIWMSQTVHISGYSDVTVSADVSESGDHESTDYIRLYYKLDGGSETIFSTNGDNSDDFTSVTASHSGVNGDSLVFVIRVKNNAGTEYLRFDNITVGGTLVGGNTTVQFVSSSASISESAGTYTVGVSIKNEDVANPTTVSMVLTSSGSATNGSDISTYTSQTLSFPAGSSGDEGVTITVTDDSDFESEETLVFQLQNATGGKSATLGVPNQMTVTIEDNDAPKIVINEILADPPGDHSGDANVDGTRDSSEDEFVELVNNHGSSVNISGWTLSDKISIRHTFPNNTVLSNGGAIVIFGGGSPQGSFSGSLIQTASTGGLGLNNAGDDMVLKGSNGAIVASHTYAGEAGQDQSITRDPDITGSFVKHSGATDAKGALFSPGTKVNGRPFIGVTIQESLGGTSVTEGGTTDTYTVVLESQPTANVSITISPDAETTVNPGSLTFTASNYNTAQTVTVSAIDDGNIEGSHTSTITHSASSTDANYSGIAIGNVTVTVADNDAASVVISESGATTGVTEGGSTDSYTLALASAPTSDVHIAIGVSNGQVTVSPTSVTFSASSYDEPQTIAVTAVDDIDYEGKHSSTITHTATSNDASYNGIVVSNVLVNITDNDVPKIVINEIHYNPGSAQGTDADYEFLELHNPGSETFHLAGCTFRDGITHVFSSSDSVAAGRYLLLAKNGVTYSGSVEWTTGFLTNDGETVVLVTDGGSVIDSVAYNRTAPWPPSANGGGPSLELKDPSLDNAIANNWQASYVIGGTPGDLNSKNTAPVAEPDTYAVNEDHTLALTAPGILDNDTDSNGDVLLATLTGNVSHGTLTLNSDGSFTYLPAEDYYGTDHFAYVANDDSDSSTETTVTITVNPVNDAPYISGISASDSILEDSGVQRIGLRGIYAGPENESQALAVTATSKNTDLIPHPEATYVSPDSVGTVTYVPTPNAYGTTTITVMIRDDGGTTNGGIDSTVVVQEVTVIPADDPPGVALRDVTIHEDSSATILLPATDVDGDSLAYLSVSADTASVTARLSAPNREPELLLVPSANWHGIAGLSLRLTDGSTEDTVTFLLTVTPVNDLPDPFNLVWPEDNMVIWITENMLADPLIFVWGVSGDVDGDAIKYKLVVSDSLSFLAREGIVDNSLRLGFSDVIVKMADIDVVSGSWTVVASDGLETTEAANGPFNLTLDAPTLLVQDAGLIPKVFALHQSYPNPFNPVTRIRYDIPVISEIRVDVYDLLGHKVGTLVSGMHAPGFYRVAWSGRHDVGVQLAAGVYIYRMEATDLSTGRIAFSRTRKFVLLK